MPVICSDRAPKTEILCPALLQIQLKVVKCADFPFGAKSCGLAILLFDVHIFEYRQHA
jgi:hypothetical protein